MRLAVRSFLAVTVLAGGGVLLSIAAVRTQVLDGFEALEREEASARAQEVARLFDTLHRDYRVMSQDWAEWTDMARYLHDGNDTFREENIAVDSFAVKAWGQMAIVRSDLTRVYAGRPGDAEILPPTAEFQALIDARTVVPEAGRERAIEGLVLLDGAVWELAAQPILNTDRTPGATPGMMVFARPIDDAWIARAEELTALDLDVRSAPAATRAGGQWAAAVAARSGTVLVEEIDDRNIASYTPLADYLGRPVGVLRVAEDRPASAAGATVLGTMIRGLLLGGVLGTVLLLTLVRRSIVRPLERLADATGRLEKGERVELRDLPADEIGQLGQAFNQMSAALRDREDALRRSVAQITRVLDHTGDAFVTCDLDGNMVGPCSAAGRSWFGAPAGSVSTWLYGVGSDEKGMFDLGLEALRDGFMPDELIFDQMPTTFSRGERTYAAALRRIQLDDDRLGLLIVTRDITAEVGRKRSEEQARELQAVVARLIRDRADFQRFVAESDALFAVIREGGDPTALRRALHTVKGNMAVFGFQSVADAAHAAEDRLRDDPDVDPLTVVQPVAQAWWAAIHRVTDVVPVDDTSVEVDPDEVRGVAEAIRRMDGADGLGARVAAWLTTPIQRVLRRSADTALRVAGQLGRRVEVEIDAEDVRVEAEATRSVWTALGHLVRNAVDHGIEPPEERAALGKPPVGRVVLRARASGPQLSVAVVDDGRGILWAKLAERAAALGLPHDTHEDLVEAMFADGVSTRDAVTEISGRGVGMAALKTAVDELGGQVRVTSVAGAGTTVELLLPTVIDGRVVAVVYEPIARAAVA